MDKSEWRRLFIGYKVIAGYVNRIILQPESLNLKDVCLNVYGS